MNAMAYLGRVAAVYGAWLLWSWLVLAMLWAWIMEPVFHWRALYLSELLALAVASSPFVFRAPAPRDLAAGWQLSGAIIEKVSVPTVVLSAAWLFHAVSA